MLHYDSDRLRFVIGRADMLGRRLIALALAIPLLSAACVASPEQQPERLRKAAGLTSLKIQCHKDMWERTGEKFDIEGKVTKGEAGLVTVELSGPQVVDLLEALDRAFNDGLGMADDPVAERMYDALAPVIDGIKATPRPDDVVPVVVVDDSVGAAVSDSPTPSVSPTR